MNTDKRTPVISLKGITAFKDDDERFVIQGAHMTLEGDHQRPWKVDEPRMARLVFIGRDLPREAIEQGFRRCIAQEQVLTA